MSDDALPRSTWERILDDADTTTFGELVAVLEERDADMLPADPETVVDAAIDDGPLVEDPDAPGAFAEYRLAADDREEARSGAVCDDATPRGRGPETAEEAAQDRADSGERANPRASFREMYLDAWSRSDDDRALVAHEHIEAAFQAAGWEELLGSLPYSTWTVWTPESRDTPLYAYTPDLAGDTTAERERVAELLAEAGVGSERFIDVLDGQKASFDTGQFRAPDDDELSGNYGIKGGRGGDPDGYWLVDIDVDDYDEAKESNERVERLRGETLAVASAHTTRERPGHLYVAVDGDPRQIVRDYTGREIDNPAASFGEIRLDEQYCVGPGSEIVCGCERCSDADAPDHFGRYELAAEKPPVVWSEEQFRDFIAADPAITPESERDDNDNAPGNSGGDNSGSFTGDLSARLEVAKRVDDAVADALQEAKNPDDRSEADARLAFAVAPWLGYDDSEIREVLDDHGTSKWASRGDSYRDSVLNFRRSADAYDPLPYWAVREFAVDAGIVEREDLVQRDSDTGEIVEDSDGDSYTALPDAESYQRALSEIEDLGVDHGRDADDGTTPAALAAEDLLQQDTTLAREEAWRAASAVGPEDLDAGVGLDTDGKAWLCPTCGEPVGDVVRALALADGLLECCGDTFADAADYDRLYAEARDRGAPLPEYISPTQAVSDMDRARGAAEALRGWDLLDELESDVTNRSPSGADAVAEIDPTWEDSDSGERIVLFNSGLFYCREHNRVLWPLQIVALEQGIVNDESVPLKHEFFMPAYALARTQYGAPLPPISWNDTEAAPEPVFLPVLPDAEDLLGEGVTTDRGGLDEARQQTTELYRDLASESGADNYLLTASPGIGKSHNAVVQAEDFPTLYTAKRLELRKEAAERAREHGVGVMHLPTLGESRPPEAVLTAAQRYVREHGRSALEDREALLDAVEDAYHATPESWPAYDDERGGAQADECEHADPHDYTAGDACPGCGDRFDTTSATRTHLDDCERVGKESVNLDRAACGCGDGAHGAAWQLAVWTARKLGDRPRELHVRGEAIFGETPPCAEGEGCPYTLAWERATDPDAPVDLLIGHPVHAYVSGARTQPQRTGRDGEGVCVEDRVVALDEFPADAYTRRFDDAAVQHARWLASCLAPEVDDTTDLVERRTDLWTDDFVRDWLNGDAAPPLRETLAAKRDQALDADAPGLTGADWDAVREHLDDAPVCGDLRDLVARAVETATDPDADPAKVETLLDAALTALRGGREGADALASGAEDGYAHPDAYWLLLAVLAPDDATPTETTDLDEAENLGRCDRVDATVREAEHFDLGTDNGRIKAVTINDRQRILLDRDHAGADLLLPPTLDNNTVIGLDATGRTELWDLAVGAGFDTADVHETAAERRAFLREVLNLRVVQTSPHVHTYSGDPTSKSFGDDLALVDKVADQFGDQQVAQDRLTTTDAPAVVTTKKVEDYLGDELRDRGAASVDHYGDLIGSNRLDEHRVGVILGAEHYGHHEAERWALLAGESFETTGHGTELDYDSSTANALLKRMREDKVMQSIMRFGRDEEGAVVFAHTAALRDDLPVVAHGDVASAWTDGQAAVGRAAADRQGEAFTVSEILEDDRVDCSRRTVRRTLNRFADEGYLHVQRGHTNRYETVEHPGAGSAELPEVEGPTADPGGPSVESGQTDLENTNTRFVWSADEYGGGVVRSEATPGAMGAPPDDPEAFDAVAPPG